MAQRTNSADESLVELFDMQAAERGAGKNTLDAYRNDSPICSRSVRRKSASPKRPPTTCVISRPWPSAVLRLRPLARRLSAVRQLYRFLYAEGKRSDDPAAVLEGPKRARTLPKVLSIAEVDGLLTQARTQAEDAKSPPAVRLRAARLLCLLEVVYATGLRVSELVALPASAARKDQRMLVVRGKGNKDRLVPLNGAAKQAMAEYLKLRADAESGVAIEMAVPSFGEQGATSPASISPANSKASARPAASRRSA